MKMFNGLVRFFCVFVCFFCLFIYLMSLSYGFVSNVVFLRIWLCIYFSFDFVQLYYLVDEDLIST